MEQYPEDRRSAEGKFVDVEAVRVRRSGIGEWTLADGGMAAISNPRRDH